MDRINPPKGAALPNQTTNTFTSARLRATYPSLSRHIAPVATALPGGPSRPTKALPGGPYQHPPFPTIAQRIYQRLLDSTLTAIPTPTTSDPLQIPSPEHMLRARALTRRLQEAINAVPDPTACDNEDDIETDGAEDMTPSPPDYRSWRPVNGQQQGQQYKERVASLKRAAVDGVDGGRQVKKARGGGSIFQKGF